MKRILLIFSILSASLWCNLPAQPQLNFKRVINNWPTIELYFMVGCNGSPAYFTDKRYFKVVENGDEIGEFELWCPDLSYHCSISVALVLDAGNGMKGAGNVYEKAAGRAFVDLMDGVNDEAVVIWADSTAQVRQGMTTSQDALYKAIDSVPATGEPALWDGVYTGLLELINDGVNQCRRVVVLTNGKDSTSQRSIAEVITLASRNRIKVYAIGLGESFDPAQLQILAGATEGRYYGTPNLGNMYAIYEDISTDIFQGFFECLITYQAKCMDGSLRTVDLSLMNFCGGSDTKAKTFKAMRDTTTFTPLRIQPGRKEAGVSKPVSIPLELLDPISAYFIHPATWTLMYDTSCARFTGIDTPPGSLLEGVPVAITRIAGGVTFQTMDRKLVNVVSVPALIVELKFEIINPGGKDTIRCPLHLTNWRFDAGCYKSVLQDGEIVILPGASDAGEPAVMKHIFDIGPIHPNPFRSSASVPFVLPERAHIRIRVYDALGRPVRMLADEWMNAGRHNVEFNAAGLPPGVYLCRLEAGGKTMARKMIIN
jgi:hypothetical protein